MANVPLRLTKVEYEGLLPPSTRPGIWYTTAEQQEKLYSQLVGKARHEVPSFVRHSYDQLYAYMTGKGALHELDTFTYDPEDYRAEFDDENYVRTWYGVCTMREYDRNEFGVVLP